MDSEERFWLGLWAMAAAVVVVITAAVTHNSIKSNEAVRALVESGTPPLEAHCAIHGRIPNENYCALLAAK